VKVTQRGAAARGAAMGGGPAGRAAAETAGGQSGAQFGDLLREFRAARGLSQSAVAARAGVDRSYVNRLEAGERGAPAPAAVDALADALELSDDEADRLLAAAELLPRSLRRLGAGDPTLLLLAQRLTDRRLTATSRAALRATLEAVLHHWDASVAGTPPVVRAGQEEGKGRDGR
jgi:transcriptional regulator with XRE-family HTH domain